MLHQSRGNSTLDTKRDEIERGNAMTEADQDPRVSQNLDEQLDGAAEDLITGDSDDPPLSDDTVAEMLESTLDARKPDQSNDV